MNGGSVAQELENSAKANATNSSTAAAMPSGYRLVGWFIVCPWKRIGQNDLRCHFVAWEPLGNIGTNVKVYQQVPFGRVSQSKHIYILFRGCEFFVTRRVSFEVALAVFLLENHNPTRQRGKFQTRVFPR